MPQTFELPFPREFMLARARARDAGYDGRFLTCVRSTGIYCLPSCKARTPKPENVVHAGSPEQARAMGFRACLRCRPDAHHAGRDLDCEALQGAVTAMRAAPGDCTGAAALARRSGFGASKLAQLCRQHYHASPAELLLRARLAFARQQLAATRRSVLDIGLDAGFASSSAFHERFVERTGTTPRGYRRLGEASQFALQLPRGVRAESLLAYLGRDPLAACERVTGRTAWLALPLAGTPSVLSLQFDGAAVRVRVDGAASPAARFAAHATAARLLHLDGGTAGAERHFAGLAAGRALLPHNRGERVLLTPTPFAALLWAILGQQINLQFCCDLRAAVVRRCGARLGDLHAHPEPEAIAQLDVADLRALRCSQPKAEHLLTAARAVASGALPLAALATAPVSRVERALLALRGIGPWSAQYVLLRGFGAADCLPAGDTALATSLQRLCELDHRPDAREQQLLAAPFAPHRSLLTWWLWRRFAADCRARIRKTRRPAPALLGT